MRENYYFGIYQMRKLIFFIILNNSHEKRNQNILKFKLISEWTQVEYKISETNKLYIYYI